MRIIAGEFRGRVIKFPNSKAVRPTTDKVKESLFNHLCNQMDFDSISVCDIYGGSGSLGLETKSRGAGLVHFVENNFTCGKVLQENIDSLGVTESCYIYKLDAVKFSKLATHNTYDLILADPPFFKYDIYDVFNNLIENNFINPGGVLIIERSIQTLDKDIFNFKAEPFKRIGDSCIFKFTF
ncbi:MAG: 16S rRNA (guanine(966)-N(2))-methyltransferase RsmD [bacterium]